MANEPTKQKPNSVDEIALKSTLGTGFVVGVGSAMYGAATGQDSYKYFGLGVAGASCITFFSVYGKQLVSELKNYSDDNLDLHDD